METFKKPTKSKFITEDLNDLLDSSQFLNDSPKIRKMKRQVKAENEVQNYLSKAVKPTPVKKQKVSEDIDSSEESCQRTLNVMNRQFQDRKQINDDFLKDLTEVISNIEADHIQLKDNAQKMEQMAGCFMKRMQQISAKQKEDLKVFNDILTTFKKEAEGLILRGAIKPDDRPLWFDVYKSFPPTAEPKFARPKPENQTIKPILYKEDVIRAKFHAKGHGLSVNMLSLTGETQTKKLIQKYQQLQSEGVAEEELLQKSVEAVGSARQATETTKMTPKNPDSVTAKVLSEADLKNIFKE